MDGEVRFIPSRTAYWMNQELLLPVPLLPVPHRLRANRRLLPVVPMSRWQGLWGLLCAPVTLVLNYPMLTLMKLLRERQKSCLRNFGEKSVNQMIGIRLLLGFLQEILLISFLMFRLLVRLRFTSGIRLFQIKTYSL